MKKIDFRNVSVPFAKRKLMKGGYIVEIKDITDFPLKECFLVKYDICEGYYADYFQSIYDAKQQWKGTFFISYQNNIRSLRFFKVFIEAIEKSNEGYIFDYDENTLIGKKLGLVFMEQVKKVKGNEYKEWISIVPCNNLRTVIKP